MDALSWLLISWIAVCGAVFFVVQTILPIFIPPGKPAEFSPVKNIERGKEEEKIEFRKQETSQTAQSPSAFTSWAASAVEAVKGIGKSQQGESCEWMNHLLIWLHRNIRRSPDVTNAWLRAMNEASNKLAASLGCDVYYEEANVIQNLTERKDEDAPKLSAVRSEFGPGEHLTLRTNLVYPKLTLRLVASQKLPDRLIVSNYLATLKDLNGEAQVRMAYVQNELFLMVSFNDKPEVVVSLENSDKNAVERVDPALVEEIVKRCLAAAVTNICLGKQQQLNGDISSGKNRDIVSVSDIDKMQATSMQERLRSRRLLVTVQRADKVGGGDVPSQPFVVLELDEPAQKHETTLSLNSYPIWEEQFLFDLNDRSEEILLELYDPKTDAAGKKLEPRFLGLAIVGIEELRQSPNRKHVLALQSRPYKSDSVSGTLEVEFVFFRNSRSDAKGANEDSTLVKSVSQYADGELDNHQTTVDRKPMQTLSPQSADVIAKGRSPQYDDRSRKPERSFFANLKRKLSFKKNRNKRALSLEADIDGRRGQNQSQARSVSTPPSRDASTTRRPDHTPMTSDSEMSVTSNESVFPQSQLVVEVIDNGLKKYYLIPTPVQRHAIGKRIMKSGKKLHIFNSHMFTATKTAPGSTCAVCKKLIASGFRRKGYQCRDCGFVCHKRCHYKTESNCPSDRISGLPIEVVKLN